MMFFGANGMRVASQFGATCQQVARQAVRLSGPLLTRAGNAGQLPVTRLIAPAVPGYSYGQLVARSINPHASGYKAFDRLQQAHTTLLSQSQGLGTRWGAAALPEGLGVPTVRDASAALETQFDFPHLQHLLAGQGSAEDCALGALQLCNGAAIAMATGDALAHAIDRSAPRFALTSLGIAATPSAALAMLLL